MASLQKLALFFIIVTGLVFIAFWLTVKTYVYKSTALQPLVHIYLNPNSASFPIDGLKVINALIQPANSGNKISGFDINFTTVGPIAVENVGTPSVYGSGNTSIFTSVINTQTRASYVVSVPEAQWPNAVVIPVTIRGVYPGGQASLHVGIGATKVTGNISGGVYDFGTVEQGNYSIGYVAATPTSTSRPTPIPTLPPTCSICLTQGKQYRCYNTLTGATYCSLYNETGFEISCTNCAGSTPIPSKSPTKTPSKVPTQTPTRMPTGCPLKTRGDSNCDGKIDLVDFEIWRKEAMGALITKNANFNPSVDSVVNIVDFEIWRKGFFM